MAWYSRLLDGLGLGLGRELRVVLALAGPARCERAVALLRRLAAEGRAHRLHRAWEALELPLVEVLPDCPPVLKEQLRQVLEACHRTTSNRRYQQRIMDLRRSLIPDPDRGG